MATTQENDGQESQNKLSKRGWANVATIMPKIKGAVAERSKPTSENIDLSTSDNWLIRPEVMDFCRRALDSGLHEKHFSYAKGITGEPDCVKAFAEFFNAYFHPHVPVETSHCITGSGAAGCIDALLYNICDPGDAILLPAPYWSGIDFTIKNRSSVVPIAVPVENVHSTLSEALIPALEAALADAQVPVRAVLICNPHNPLGQCYPKAVLEACVRFCNAHNLHLISDEIYALTNFDTDDLPVDQRVPFVSALALDLPSLGADGSSVHTVWSTSKDLGQNGVRMGCTVTQSNPELAIGHALAGLYLTSSLSAIFVSALLTSPELPTLLSLNSRRLATAYRRMTTFLARNHIPYVPCYAGLYVFAKIAPKATSWEEEAKAVARLKDAGVVVSAGRDYHVGENEPGWARINFTIGDEKLEEAIRRMQNVYDGDKEEKVEGKGGQD